MSEDLEVKTCRKCGAILKEGQEFCTQCGTSIKRICTNCGNELKEGELFCPKCGTKYEEKKEDNPPQTPKKEKTVVKKKEKPVKDVSNASNKNKFILADCIGVVAIVAIICIVIFGGEKEKTYNLDTVFTKEQTINVSDYPNLMSGTATWKGKTVDVSVNISGDQTNVACSAATKIEEEDTYCVCENELGQTENFYISKTKDGLKIHMEGEGMTFK